MFPVVIYNASLISLIHEIINHKETSKHLFNERRTAFLLAEIDNIRCFRQQITGEAYEKNNGLPVIDQSVDRLTERQPIGSNRWTGGLRAGSPGAGGWGANGDAQLVWSDLLLSSRVSRAYIRRCL